MIDMSLDEAKSKFIDVNKMVDAADRASISALAKFGAYVRQRAISSIRTRKRVSNPGEPPSSHTGIYKRFIFYFVERTQKNVVIGPIKLGGRAGTAPKALEHGGETAIARRHGDKRSAKVNVAARPHMQPAFDTEIKKAAELLKNAVK